MFWHLLRKYTYTTHFSNFCEIYLWILSKITGSQGALTTYGTCIHLFALAHTYIWKFLEHISFWNVLEYSSDRLVRVRNPAIIILDPGTGSLQFYQRFKEISEKSSIFYKNFMILLLYRYLFDTIFFVYGNLNVKIGSGSGCIRHKMAIRIRDSGVRIRGSRSLLRACLWNRYSLK